ncbi:MAG: SAM-dependent chlorinase/fluorinase [Actinomycetes bacterium]
MTLRYDTISFLSDYGHTDEFVGVVHSVIRQISPAVRVIDITHEVAPYDVRAAGLALGRAAQYLAPGVVIAVVDPGVGSGRRAVAVEVGNGQSILLGPDNGVLAPAVAMVGGATRAVWLNNPEYHLAGAGSLFDGRDVFASVAAHLCNGVPLEELGEFIEPAGLIPGTLPISELDDDVLTAEVLWVDRYGNAQLNADPEELDGLGTVFELNLQAAASVGTTGSTGSTVRTVKRVRSFSELTTGALGLVIDSYGAVALVCDRASAAEELGLETGDALSLRPLDSADDPARGVTTPVQLSPSFRPQS